MESLLITTITNDIDEFSSHIIKTYKPWPGYMFRGQANSEWPIESSLQRRLKHLDEQAKEIEKIRHYNRFRDNIRGRRGENPNKLNETELKALGQHYGLCTTLLDWTRSPYVALFFALINCTPDIDNCAVFCINTDYVDDVNAINKKMNKTWNVDVIEPEDDFNKRIVNQAGLFLDISLSVDLKEWINNAPDYPFVFFEKIIISSKLRNDGLLMLNQMNINYNSLFPDIIGSSNDANLRLELREYIDKQQTKEWDENA